VLRRIVRQSFDRQFHGSACAREPVKNVGCIRARLHEDALFKERIGQSERPYGRGSLQVKSFDVQVTLGRECAVRPAVREEFVRVLAVSRRFFEPGKQQRAPHRRIERGNQQSMVGARLKPGNCPESVPAQAVCHQPFARFRSAQVAANFAAEIYGPRKLCTGRLRKPAHGNNMASWKINLKFEDFRFETLAASNRADLRSTPQTAKVQDYPA